MGYLENGLENSLYDSEFEHDACGFGFVCNVKGAVASSIVQNGLTILKNMNHRGAVGSEPNSGDGAGILLQIPDKFFRKCLAQQGIEIPDLVEYGVGQFFFPQGKAEREQIKNIVTNVLKKELDLIAWRSVPTNNSFLGETPLKNEPVIEQLFVKRKKKKHPSDSKRKLASSASDGKEISLESKLYLLRKVIEKKVDLSKVPTKDYFFPVSFSSKTIVYKGQLTTYQLGEYYLDLQDPDMESALAIVHSRFSTNTFPSWKLAHPFRVVAHNGEINTKRGNVNWMKAREPFLDSNVYKKDDIIAMQPLVRKENSDSMNFDSMLEFLVKSGKSISEAMMILIPEAWEEDHLMEKAKRDFYRFYAGFIEPWDGPAAIAFTDGRYIGGVLDRNGLRPSRYTLYDDDVLVMASEGGVIDRSFDKVVLNRKLEPGKILLIDLEEGKILSDREVKHQIAKKLPYNEWQEKIFSLTKLTKLIPQSKTKSLRSSNSKNSGEESLSLFSKLARVYGYSQEDFRTVLLPMLTTGSETTGSMGRDIPLAVLSKKPVLLFNYFYQLFAQVTNPPIDPIREKKFMSLKVYLGPQKKLFDLNKKFIPRPLLECDSPILTEREMELLRKKQVQQVGKSKFLLNSRIISSSYQVEEGLEKALKRVIKQVEQAVEHEKNPAEIIIISDKEVRNKQMFIPSLLITSAVHQELVKKKNRSKCSIVIETGEARETHHMALLLGFGANAVNPYLVWESFDWLKEEGLVSRKILNQKLSENYRKAIDKGLLKIISKMGISTIRSYIGAQIFEAIGIGEELIDKYFSGLQSRIGGIGLKELERDYRWHLNYAFPALSSSPDKAIKANFKGNFGLSNLVAGGDYQWRLRGEKHLFNPETVHLLQHSCRTNNYELFTAYSKKVDDQSDDVFTLRGLLEFSDSTSIPIDQVEPKEEIFKRFVTGAMSFGSISWEAHTLLAKAMNYLGGRSNTGEGGEDPIRYVKQEDGISLRSAIKQIASGRFGVTANYLVNADEIQIKVAQGAKPGEGGQLPGHKVDSVIAKVRHSTPGVELISPPPHHDIYSIEDLAELIFDLKSINPRAEVSVKLVSSLGVGTIAAGVVKGYADKVIIAGHDGGTGASPISSIKYAGLPWELGLAETHQTLVLNKLRQRARLQTDGQIKTARDMVIATLLGAEEWGLATTALVVMGCIIMRKCHLNTCPVGVATQRKELRKLFSGELSHLINFFTFLAEDTRKIMAQLGFSTVNEMVGRVDKLKVRSDLKKIGNPKIEKIDLSKLLYSPDVKRVSDNFCCVAQSNIVAKNFEQKYLKEIREKIAKKTKVSISSKIKNTDRAVGSLTSYEITKVYGEKGLPRKSVNFFLEGSAGQSFAAFATKGMNFVLQGEANDYFAKGLSGADIVVKFPEGQSSRLNGFVPSQVGSEAGQTGASSSNIILGNVALYGATSGNVYVGGLAGERFGVRNSGVEAVVEGIGVHGLEYMTGGKVIVLGEIGRNFASGMSGGIAYIHKAKANLNNVNLEMVNIKPISDKKEILYFKHKITEHYKLTGSERAGYILGDFEEHIKQFVKVIPTQYEKILLALEEQGKKEKKPSNLKLEKRVNKKNTNKVA